LDVTIRAINRPLVIVIDQFEEFFIRLGPESRIEFIAELGMLYDAGNLRVKLVLSLREDHLANISELENRIPEVFRTRMRLLPLTREQARDAIVYPIEAQGYAYEIALLEQLLDDLTNGGVMPSQLQLVCSALYRRAHTKDRETLTMTDYEALGEVQGVLRGYLQEELSRFPLKERTLARQILEALVTAEHTRKIQTRAELLRVLDTDESRLTAALVKLVAARLLNPLESMKANKPAYELTHDYLVEIISEDVSAEQLSSKAAKETLQREMITYRAMKRQGQERWLIDTDTIRFINNHQKALGHLGKAEIELLFRSSIAAGGYNTGYWFDQALNASLSVESLLKNTEALLFTAIRRRLDELIREKEIPPTTIIVAAEFGYIKKARACAQALDLPLALIEKREKSGDIHHRLLGSSERQHLVIVDDEIVTGKTISTAADIVLSGDEKTKATICSTYTALDRSSAIRLKRYSGRVERLITTDAIPIPDIVKAELDQAFIVEILSTSEIVEEIMMNVHNGEQFENWWESQGLMRFDEKLWLKSHGLRKTSFLGSDSPVEGMNEL
jgi:orotate phosphoribosyltransferase